MARHVASVSSYTPHRVYKSNKKRFTDFESMLADVAKADLVYLGEQHDDPGTHRLERAALEGIGRRHPKVVLSLEMFERDVQAKLDDYLAGRIDEADFLKASRPWPKYATDYRPLVEFAKAKGWPVVAANVPRRLASLVGRKGLPGVDSLPAADRALIAAELSCPRDEYFDRFKESMGDMSGHGQKITAEEAAAMVGRFYDAQCVKDETMAEAIAAARAKYPDAVIVHVNGDFHSAFGLGTVERAKRRLPGTRSAVISFSPVVDLDVADGKKIRKQGHYIVFTLKPPTPPKVPAPANVPAAPAAAPAAPAAAPKPPAPIN
ncbi:MAG: ChaN family lipoprotein [Gemmatimonadota bacterium]|nr:ChaN family lipoprotein [Gemmatimonadota bacterium]